MIPRILLIVFLGFSALHAAEPAPEDLLRQGLFEEEANHDLDKAAERYRAVIAAHDRQRALAASANFRLGEIARKKNDKDAAAAAFRMVAERFPEQTELARLSRENLAALGIAAPTATTAETPSAPQAADPEETEIARLKDIARNSPDLIDGPSSDGWRPMHLAAKNGWTKVIAYLLENKADSNSRTTREQLTPLQITTFQGHLGAMKALLVAKADIDATFGIGACPDGVLPAQDRKANGMEGKWSALDLAILYDRREIARTLIQAGADIKRMGPARKIGVQPASPYTTLQLAIILERNELAVALIEAGAPLGTGSHTETSSPLCLAVTDSPELVAPLLKAGADPKEAGTKDGFTPLHLAAAYKAVNATKLLLDAGADANAVNAEGQTPLHLTYHPEMVELLVSRGANPNAKDKRGYTPLDGVAERGEQNPAVFEALLKHGAVVDDAKELLKHTSPQMRPIVRERVAYPKEWREDAILFSSGNLLKISDIRPAKGSPPPSLREALAYLENNYLASLKIIRRDANGNLAKLFERSPDSGRNPLETPPPLEWGDIVEAEVDNNSGSSSINLFSNEIPPQSITIRVGGISFPRRFTAPSGMWLNPINPEKEPNFERGGRQPRPRVVPPPAPGYPQPQRQPGQPGQPQLSAQPSTFSDFSLMPGYFDFSRITVTRKGVEKPISVDLTRKDSRVFRLIDGDVLELVMLESFRKEMEQKKLSLYVCGDFAQAGSLTANGLLRSLIEARITNDNGIFPNGPDWSDIRIIRNDKKLKVERFDFVDWTRKLTLGEEWTEATLDGVPTLKPGDIVVIPLFPADANEDRREANQYAEDQISSNRKVIIPPNSSGPPRVPGIR